MADFLEWSVHKAGFVTFSLPRLDALLRASGLSAGLASCLTAEGGPLHDEAARRRASRNAREAASNRLWAEAEAFRRSPPLMAAGVACRRAEDGAAARIGPSARSGRAGLRWISPSGLRHKILGMPVKSRCAPHSRISRIVSSDSP